MLKIMCALVRLNFLNVPRIVGLHTAVCTAVRMALHVDTVQRTIISISVFRASPISIFSIQSESFPNSKRAAAQSMLQRNFGPIHTAGCIRSCTRGRERRHVDKLLAISINAVSHTAGVGSLALAAC